MKGFRDGLEIASSSGPTERAQAAVGNLHAQPDRATGGVFEMMVHIVDAEGELATAFGLPQRQRGVVAAHEDQARLLARRSRRKLDDGFHDEFARGKFLEQQIGRAGQRAAGNKLRK